MLCPTSTQQMPTNAWCSQGVAIPTLGASANHGYVKGGPGPPALSGSTEQSRASLSTQRQHPWGRSQSVTYCRERRAPWGEGEGHWSPYTCPDFHKDNVREKWGWREPNHQWHTPGSGQSPGSQQLQETVPGSAYPDRVRSRKPSTAIPPLCYLVAREPDRFQPSLTFPPPKPLPMAVESLWQGPCPLPATGEAPCLQPAPLPFRRKMLTRGPHG